MPGVTGIRAENPLTSSLKKGDMQRGVRVEGGEEILWKVAYIIQRAEETGGFEEGTLTSRYVWAAPLDP